MLIHWIWLAYRPGLTDRMKVRLLQHFQDPEDIYFAREDAFSHIEGMTKEALDGLRDKVLIPSEEILEDCSREKIHILTYRDAAYPTRLKHIADPPLVLYYKGSLPDFNGSPLIGVVGTRKASAYGLQCAKRMGYQISRCGGIVVSGIASGIDAAAMSGALTAGSPVVAILGNGADVVYPHSNRGLYADTERYGCLLSEFPPKTPPYRWNFPKRNRIISGLSCGVLVVEAPEGSGSLITANQALEQGRDVFVVPGNIDQPGFVGSNRLLRDGGILAGTGWDVMSEYKDLFPDKVRMDLTSPRLRAYPDEVGKIAESGISHQKVAQKQAVPAAKQTKIEKSNKKVVDIAASSAYSDVNKDLPELTDQEKAIVDAIRGGAELVDEVIAKVGLSAAQISSALTMLVIKGVVQKLPGNRVSLK